MKGVLTIAMVLANLTTSPSLAPRRAELAAAVVRAETVMRGFAARNGWRREGAVRAFDSVEIFDDQRALFRRILELDHMPLDTPMPVSGLAAAIEGRVLVALSPEAYARVAASYAAVPEAWPRLLAHEMVHRLHVEVLQGDEEAMGPQWFYEGFACYGAGQRIDEGIAYASAAEALSAVRGKAPYSKYLAAVRYFARRTSVPRLVARAGRSDFEAWLRTLR